MNMRFFLTMLGKAALFFVVFYAFYVAVQPLGNTSLTLYNHLFPGRLRFAWTDQNGVYLTNETVIPRLIADHAISRPKAPDEYRIIVLGSSEIWGFDLLAEETAPVILDMMRLSTPDGRRVRVYNLGYIRADGFKDALILQAALDAGAQPDLVIFGVNIYTFSPKTDAHWLTEDNPDFALEVIERYQFESVPREPLLARMNEAPYWWRHGFIEQRSDIAAWLINQAYGFAWGTLGEDYPDAPIPGGQFTAEAPINREITRPDLLDGLVRMTQEQGIPLLIFDTPASYVYPEAYTDWLTERTTALNLLHLNCTNLLPPVEYPHSRLHFTPAGHQQVSEQITAWLTDYWQRPILSTTCPHYTGT